MKKVNIGLGLTLKLTLYTLYDHFFYYARTSNPEKTYFCHSLVFIIKKKKNFAPTLKMTFFPHFLGFHQQQKPFAQLVPGEEEDTRELLVEASNRLQVHIGQ